MTQDLKNSISVMFFGKGPGIVFEANLRESIISSENEEKIIRQRLIEKMKAAPVPCEIKETNWFLFGFWFFSADELDEEGLNKMILLTKYLEKECHCKAEVFG